MLDADEYFSTRTGEEDLPSTVPVVDPDFGQLPSHDLISVTTPDDNSERAMKRPRLSSSYPASIWTKDADDQLRYIMEQIAPNWHKICEQIQSVHPDLSLTPDECEKRWAFLSKLSKHSSMPSSAAKESKKSKEFPTWNDDERQLLLSLVLQAQKGDGFNANRNMQATPEPAVTGANNIANVKVISWLNIARQLNRTTEDVNHQWNQIRLAQFRKGAFTEEEDCLIIQRVREWNSMPMVNNKPRLGIWVALEKELNREDKRISERWRSILSKRIAAAEMNSEMGILPLVKGGLEGSEMNVSNAAINAAAIVVKEMDMDEDERGMNHHRYHQHHSGTSAEHHQQAALRDAAKYAASVVCNTGQEEDDDDDSSTGSTTAPPLPPRLSGLKSLPNHTSSSSSSANNNNAPGTPGNNALLSSPPPSLSKSVRWNHAMDSALREAMTYFGSDWKKIAEYVNQHQGSHGGSFVDDNKCRGRYYRAIRADHGDENNNNLGNLTGSTVGGPGSAGGSNGAGGSSSNNNGMNGMMKASNNNNNTNNSNDTMMSSSFSSTASSAT